MNQVHRILTLSILRKEMTSSGIPLNHPFHGVRGMKFIDSLMYFIGHFSTIGSLSLVIGIFPAKREGCLLRFLCVDIPLYAHSRFFNTASHLPGCGCPPSEGEALPDPNPDSY